MDPSAAVNELVSDFNKRLVTLVNYSNAITSAFGIASSGLEKEIVDTILKQIDTLEKSNSRKLIDTFVIHILANYEQDILTYNDDAFISKIVADTKQKDGNGAVFGILFSVVNIWTILQNEQKEYIKKSLKMLCVISRAYCNIIIGT